MKKDIYKLALRCKRISDESIGTDKNLIPFGKLLYTDYTIKGAVDEYREAITELQSVIANKYPVISFELRQHNNDYSRGETIVHYTAMKTIVDCILSLEEKKNMIIRN